jgi:hypothetical protein
MEIFERLNCVIIDGRSYVKASDAKLMYDEIIKLRQVLQSISNNTCCDNCQEAALVARAALKEKE